MTQDNSNPEHINEKWNSYERHCCLETADTIHILLEEYLQSYPRHLHERITVISNAAFINDGWNPAHPAASGRTIIAAGRFTETVKQFSLLLRAFALLMENFPDWRLELCGDGETKDEYQTLATRLGIAQKVRMPGMVDDLHQRYAAADIFCIPSRTEGFPLALIEAQAQALPSVGFARCPGVNNILVHGESGFLAEDMTPTCLAGYLEKLMTDAELRRAMGLRGRAMLDRYAPQKIFDAWERMLENAAERKGRTRIQKIMSQTLPPCGLPGEPAHAARELLARRHPFDRSRYLRMHEEARETRRESPFSERDIVRFVKQQKRFGFPGYRTPGYALNRLRYRLKGLFA